MSIDAFILVGGRSSRMGRDKATLRFEGETLTDRAAGTISEALEVDPRLVAAVPHQAAKIFGHGRQYEFVFDVYPNRGAYGAVHAALANARYDWAFVMACDLPYVTAQLIRVLAGRISDENDVVVPRQPDGRLQPLCSFYRVDPCVRELEKPIVRKRPTPPITKIFEHVRTSVVGFEEVERLAGAERFFLNLNSSEDLPSGGDPSAN